MATSGKKGLMDATYRSRIIYTDLPNINEKAKKVVSFRKNNGYLNSSALMKINMFQVSSVVNLNVFYANGNYIFDCTDMTSTRDNTGFKILIVDEGDYFDAYITGSYASAYSSGGALIMTSDWYATAIENGELVNVSSLTPIKELVINNS